MEGYVFVKKRLVVTWLISYLLLFAGIVFSVQYTIYTAQKWCSLVNLFNETYNSTPPTSDTGKRIAIEMAKLQRSYKCK